jgi:hypothetical protein
MVEHAGSNRWHLRQTGSRICTRNLATRVSKSTKQVEVDWPLIADTNLVSRLLSKWVTRIL